MNQDTIWKWMVTAYLGVLAYLVGIPQPMKSLITLMFLINLPLGYIAFVFRRGLTRQQFLEAGLTKVASLLFLAAAHQVEPALGLGADFHVEQKLAYLFLGHEFLCSFRYATACGVQFPAWLTQKVDQFVVQTEGAVPSSPPQPGN